MTVGSDQSQHGTSRGGSGREEGGGAAQEGGVDKEKTCVRDSEYFTGDIITILLT